MTEQQTVAPPKGALQARDLRVDLRLSDGGSLRVLNGISVTIERGEFVAVVAPSGSGKTTLLRAIAGLADPSSGSIHGPKAEPSAPFAIGMVFQRPNLVPWLTIEQNLALPWQIAGLKPPNDLTLKIHQVLSAVGLYGFRRAYPSELSGGMQMRAAIARAFVVNPTLMLFDEAFSGLDEALHDIVADELLQLWTSTKCTVLFVTHSLPDAVYLSDRVLVLSQRPARIVADHRIGLPRPRVPQHREDPLIKNIRASSSGLKSSDGAYVMNSAPISPDNIVVVDPLGELEGLADRFQDGAGWIRPALLRTASEDTRLIIFGPGASIESLEEDVASWRAQAPGAFIAWTCLKTETSRLPAAMRSADAAFVLPDDFGLLEDLVHSGRPSTRRSGRFIAMSEVAKGALVALTLLALWALIVRVFHIPRYLAPSPEAVFHEAARTPVEYGYHTLVTAVEAGIGFVFGNVIGLIAAITLWRITTLKRFAMPALIGLQSVPIVALAPLLIVWFGSGWTSKVVMSSLICFFPMTVNCLAAFGAVDADLKDYFRLHHSTFLRTVRHLILPASASPLLAALRISAGLAVVGSIVAELTGAERGLGYLLLNASYRLETERLFVAILLSALLGMAFYAAPGLLKALPAFRRFLK